MGVAMAAVSAVELAENHEMESNMYNHPRHYQRHFPTAYNYYNHRRAYAPYYLRHQNNYQRSGYQYHSIHKRSPTFGLIRDPNVRLVKAAATGVAAIGATAVAGAALGAIPAGTFTLGTLSL